MTVTDTIIEQLRNKNLNSRAIHNVLSFIVEGRHNVILVEDRVMKQIHGRELHTTLQNFGWSHGFLIYGLLNPSNGTFNLLDVITDSPENAVIPIREMQRLGGHLLRTRSLIPLSTTGFDVYIDIVNPHRQLAIGYGIPNPILFESYRPLIRESQERSLIFYNMDRRFL